MTDRSLWRVCLIRPLFILCKKTHAFVCSSTVQDEEAAGSCETSCSSREQGLMCDGCGVFHRVKTKISVSKCFFMHEILSDLCKVFFTHAELVARANRWKSRFIVPSVKANSFFVFLHYLLTKWGDKELSLLVQSCVSNFLWCDYFHVLDYRNSSVDLCGCESWWRR